MTFHALGDCTGGFDEYGQACTDFTPITSNPAATSQAINYLYNQPSATPTGNASTGFNWGSFFQGIFPTIANDATKIGQQAIASPGTVIGPGGQVITGGGTVSTPVSSTAQTINSLMPLLMIGGIGLILVVALKK